MTSEIELDAMRGHVTATNSLLISLIQTLNPLQMAQCAMHLAIEKQAALQEDAEAQTPPAEANARDTVMESYLQLLRAGAR